MSVNVNIHELLEAGVHFGHLARFRKPSMSPYIYCTRDRVSIINLDYTVELFDKALEQIEAIAKKGGKILFVGTKSAASEMIAEFATKCGMQYVDHRWLGGMLTNYKTIKKSVRRFKELEVRVADDGLKHLTKKEGLSIQRKLDKFTRSLGGIKDMVGLPDALFIIDVGYEKIAVKEANCLRIPVIGIVDSNSNPAGVDYIIPGNDDSMRSIKLYLTKVEEAINAGIAQQVKSSNKDEDDFVEVKASKISKTSKVISSK